MNTGKTLFAQTVPETPEMDSKGLAMEVVYRNVVQHKDIK
jgi:predicted RNase H-like nuclease